jgi:hypothetical protein
MPDRCTPEYERIVAKMGALLPYRRARTLLAGFLPLADLRVVETGRQRSLRVGARLEQDVVAGAGPKPAGTTKSIALSIDGAATCGRPYRPCCRPPTRRSDLDGDHRERGAMAAAPANECVAADALVAAGRSFDADRANCRRERYARPGPRRRRALVSPRRTHGRWAIYQTVCGTLARTECTR